MLLKLIRSVPSTKITWKYIEALPYLYYINLTGKFRKQVSYQRESLIEAIMISVDNLEDNLKQRYKELAVFLDDNSVPKKVV